MPACAGIQPLAGERATEPNSERMEASHTDGRDAARSAWRIVVVVVVSLVSLASQVPDVVLPWYPTAQFGFVVDTSGDVLSVARGSPADRAGIVPGARIDAKATPLDSRRYLITGGPNSARDGAQGQFVFDVGRERRTVDLVAAVSPRSLADNVTDILLICSVVALVFISGLLFLKRPSPMTLAFFLYGNATGSTAVTVTAHVPTLGIAALQGFTALLGFQSIWLVIFALRFPADSPTGWRVVAERALLLSLPILIPINIWGSVGYLLGAPPPASIEAFIALVGIGGLLASALVFVLTYVHATSAERARIRWVMLGLVVGFGGQLVYQVGSSLPGLAWAWPIWLLNLAQACEITVALTVAYAIVRHRVFDVRFFIGRAVLYAALTTAVVAALALVDFGAGKLLSGTGLAALGEAGVAVIVGLSLNVLHRRLERVVDATLFRSRIDAQRRLRRVARGLNHATTLEAIQRVVVHEPAEALHLTSVALFERVAGGRYVRGAAVGWDDAALRAIDANDPLVLQMLGSKEPLRIHDITLPPGALPAGTRRPSFALSMVVRADLEAIVFYGPHESQEELDPDEMESLEQLLADASSAYDHVRAELSQKQIDALEAQVKELRTLRALPGR